MSPTPWLMLSAAVLVAGACAVRRAPGPQAPPFVLDAGLPGAGAPGMSLGECHPSPGMRGNLLRVGQYCTKGGGECHANPPGTATACAADLDRRGGDFCVKVFCRSDGDCGPAACCYGSFLAKACVPVGCFSDAGVCPR